MKRLIIFLLCLSLMSAIFSGCGREEKPYIPTGGALDDGNGSSATTGPMDEDQPALAFPYYPDRSLNPYLCTDYTNRTIFPLLYQGLFVTGGDGTVHPVLCKEFTRSPDMRTYTLTLMDAEFSDGTTVTTQDVLASLEAARTGPYYAGRFQHITLIEAVDDRTFTVKLDTPCENLAILLDIPIVRFDQVAEDTPIATGAYVVRSSITGTQLQKLNKWWCDDVQLINTPFIPLVEAESTRQIRDEFEAGDATFVCANPCSDAYTEFRSDYELWDCENGIFLYLSTHEDSKVFSNEAIRAALPYAVDREHLVENYYRGFAQAASLPASPASPVYDQALAARYGFDPQRLKAAVEAEGMVGEEVVFLVNREDTLRLRAAKYIAQTLSACGLKVSILETTYQWADNYLRTGEYDLYLGQTRLSPNMDLTAFFAEKGNLSYAGMADVSLYALNLEALANSGNYYDLHRSVMEDGRLVPILFHRYALYSARGLLTDLAPARDNIFFYPPTRTLEDAFVED